MTLLEPTTCKSFAHLVVQINTTSLNRLLRLYILIAVNIKPRPVPTRLRENRIPTVAVNKATSYKNGATSWFWTKKWRLWPLYKLGCSHIQLYPTISVCTRCFACFSRNRNHISSRKKNVPEVIRSQIKRHTKLVLNLNFELRRSATLAPVFASEPLRCRENASANGVGLRDAQ